MDVGKLELYRRVVAVLHVAPSPRLSIPPFPSITAVPMGQPLPGCRERRAAGQRAAWRCQGEQVDASWGRLAGRRRSNTAAPVRPPRLADGAKRHLGDGAAVGPGGRLVGRAQGGGRRKARRLCVVRRRRGVVRWSEGETRWGRGDGDAPKPSIAAGAPGSDVTWRLPRRRLAWAQTEGIVEDMEPRVQND